MSSFSSSTLPPIDNSGSSGNFEESSLRRHHTLSATDRLQYARNKLELKNNYHYLNDYNGFNLPISPLNSQHQSGLHRAGSLPNKSFRSNQDNDLNDIASIITKLKHKNSLNLLNKSDMLDDLERDIEITRKVEENLLKSQVSLRRHQSLTYGQQKQPIKREHFSNFDNNDLLYQKVNLSTPSPTNNKHFNRVRSGSGSNIFDLNSQLSGLGLSDGHSPTFSHSIRPSSANNNGNNNNSGNSNNTFVNNAAYYDYQEELQELQDLQQSQHQSSLNELEQPRKLQLVTDFSNLPNIGGPVSAAPYVPPIGHSAFNPPSNVLPNQVPSLSATAALWNDRESIVGSRYEPPQTQWRFDPITGQALNNQPKTSINHRSSPNSLNNNNNVNNTNSRSSIMSPVDVNTMIAQNGYNPQKFELEPKYARYFVIKSYTEDDVHKSLKYNIWASTELGNQRLDKAFLESANKGPIYLFFSVNASGHFCGMAQMLTHVDYTTSSSVWAQDGKWKGVFKVRWIFVKDIPNSTLRHIKLNNTHEKKPVTNSRDTTELLDDAGKEMLNIFFQFNSRTSLLQDFQFYEIQSLQKQQQQQQQQQYNHNYGNFINVNNCNNNNRNHYGNFRRSTTPTPSTNNNNVISGALNGYPFATTHQGW